VLPPERSPGGGDERLAPSSPLHDLVVDEIDHGKGERRRDDQHDQRVGDPAGPGDPGCEECNAGEDSEPSQLEKAWKADASPIRPVIRVLRHRSQTTTKAATDNRVRSAVMRPSKWGR